jgi:NarL family two-component system response regulator LiaR
MNKIRILIVDDHAIVHEGLRTLISSDNDMEVIGEAYDGEEAIELSNKLSPDVILMDLVMPRVSGLEAIIRIKSENQTVRILVLTSFTEDNKVFPAIKAGASGYILKDSSPTGILDAIRAVHRGESTLHPIIAAKLIRELNKPSELPPTPNPLTERELEVLLLIAQGNSNQEIAEKMYISENTVGSHMRNILSKLHLANRTQAALYALREGLVKLD